MKKTLFDWTLLIVALAFVVSSLLILKAVKTEGAKCLVDPVGYAEQKLAETMDKNVSCPCMSNIGVINFNKP